MTTRPGTESLEAATLVLTASCNLRCRYCYQNAKSTRRMSWETLSASLDLVLASRASKVSVAFVGGEPLLEAGLIRRAVEYAGRNAPPGKRVTFAVITNGTPAGGRDLDFLIDRDVELRLSMDGVPAAQDLRGKGTFNVLDRLLRTLRREHPDYFDRKVSVGMTLVPDTAAHLAESVRYFLDRRVPSIGVSPVATHEPGWRPERIGELDEQFAAVHGLCLDHRRRTGATPLGLFQRGRDEGVRGAGVIPMCSLAKGRSIVVDVDGSVLGCTLFSNLSQRSLPGLLRRRLDAMAMGPVTHPGFAERLHRFRRWIREDDLFHDRRTKRSSYGRCGECPNLAYCAVCPVSIGHVPGNEDADRVPDFACAFYRTAGAWRERFPALPDLDEILSGSSAGPNTLCERAVARRRDIAIHSTTGA